ncbi:hypothetical protein [Actinoplanes sp. DH11]|uniref:hypothetical protein n=1 Tax=Actinoplanes sp. DH11 TaxID=2857011 RepID=UPI001E56DC20|nr:hypothetical protein [Actinoplanes sp. DH11]
MAAVVLVADLVFAAYLAFQAWSGPSEWRPWYLVGAAGLLLMIGAVAWSRFGGRSRAPDHRQPTP